MSQNLETVYASTINLEQLPFIRISEMKYVYASYKKGIIRGSNRFFY
jgi:hypothetical protein